MCRVESSNDDRLGRTLAAIGPHARTSWQDIIGVALLRLIFDVRLRSDLTALCVHGDTENALASLVLAHNNRWVSERFKIGADVVADGNLPLDYGTLVCDTSDTATVQTNPIA